MNRLSNYKSCGAVDTTITGKMLYLILCDLADQNGEIIVSQRKISDTLHISKATVSRNLRRLRDGGTIKVCPRFHNDGGRTANKYIVL